METVLQHLFKDVKHRCFLIISANISMQDYEWQVKKCSTEKKKSFDFILLFFSLS